VAAHPLTRREGKHSLEKVEENGSTERERSLPPNMRKRDKNLSSENLTISCRKENAG